MVEFLTWLIVAQNVNAMIHAPHLLGFGMPGEAERIAESRGDDRFLAAVGVDLKNGGVFRIRLTAGVAETADADVEHAIGPEAKRTVCMLASIRQIVDERLQFAERAVFAHVGDIDCMDDRQVHLVVMDRDAVHLRLFYYCFFSSAIPSPLVSRSITTSPGLGHVT
jgi:hypothetical protein